MTRNRKIKNIKILPMAYLKFIGGYFVFLYKTAIRP